MPSKIFTAQHQLLELIQRSHHSAEALFVARLGERVIQPKDHFNRQSDLC
jgi:hypothetical protein